VKRKSVAAAGAALLLAVAGCGSSAKPAAAPKARANLVKLAALPGMASCPSGTAGTLNFVGDTAGPYADNFNPFSSTVNTGAEFPFVYETLLQFSLANSKTVTPWLASGYSWSNGGKTLTFQLRHGITWSDGKPFTSADVVFTYNLIKKYPASNLRGINFDTATANGTYGVTLTFPQPSYSDLYYIGTQYIVPQHVWASLGDPTKVLNTHPVGTGPYLLTTLAQQSMTLTANPNYWQKGLPCIRTVSAPPYDSNTTADLAMEQGGGDWGGLFIAGINKYTSNPTHKYWFPPVADATIYPNLDTAPLNSLPLREAISDALNRKAIAQAADLGEEQPITNETGLILPRDGYLLGNAYTNSQFSYNVAAAKSILTAAHYSFGASGKLLDPQGKAVSFAIDVPSAFSDYVAGVEEVSAELKAIGLNVTVNSIPNTQWLSNLQLGHFQASIDYSEVGPTSFFEYDGWLYSKNSAKVGSVATTNYERFSSPQADSLVSSYLDTDDPTVQKTDMVGLEGIMVKQLPVIPLFYQTDWGEYVTQNITGWPTPSDPYQISSSYDTPMNEVTLLHLKYKS
jgi:peptide/nickel transport system substrate-binding protein